MKENKKDDSNKDENTKKDKMAVVEEKLSVGKKKVETRKVRLTKKVIEENLPQNLTGYDEEIEIDVKKVNKVVEKPGEAVRTEGDTTIYSVYREQYVKQTILEEEVWVTRKRKEKIYKTSGKLRREVIDIEREPEKLKKD